MPPSASGASRADEQALVLPDSDSDMDIDDDEEVVRVVRLRGEEGGEANSAGSLFEASWNRTDAGNDAELKRQGGVVEPRSSATAKSGGRLSLNLPAEDSNSAKPSDEQSADPKNFCTRDSRYPNADEEIGLLENRRSIELSANENDSKDFSVAIQSKDKFVCSDNKCPQGNAGIISSRPAWTSDIIVERSNGFWGPEDKQRITSADTEKGTAARFAAAYPRHGSPSTGAEMEGLKRHSTILCNSFAKGDSCRYLHANNYVNGISQYHRGDVANGNKESRHNEGIRYPSQNWTVGISSVIGRENCPIYWGSRLPDKSCFSARARIPPHSLQYMNASLASLSNHSEIGKEYGAPVSFSLQRTSYSFPPYPEPGLGNYLHKKRKISSDDWEPSEPFRPSFEIPPSILPPELLHDPVYTGISTTNKTDGSWCASSSSCQGPVIANMLDTCAYDGPACSKPRNRENSDDRTSATWQDENNENMVENNCEITGLCSVTSRTEMVETSVAEQKLWTSKKGVTSQHGRIESTQKQNTTVNSRNSRVQDKESGHNKSLRVEGFKQKSGMDAEVKRDSVLNDAKGMKVLRTALIDTVKDLLKPVWHGGSLSKDVHNIIVKKSVDKVLDSLQPHQVPISCESVDQYLSLTRPKIAKLVEGYLEKYKRS